VTFWEHFLRLLPRRPLPALAALYWHVTRRRVRARIRLHVASTDLPFAYELWTARNEDHNGPSSGLDSTMKDWQWRPRFSVALHAATGFTQEQLDRSVRSVEQQSYPNWTFSGTIAGPIGESITAADGDYLIALRIGDSLSISALFQIARTLQSNRGAAIVYGDEDQLTPRGRRTRPWFKPQWNEEMFLALDFLSSAVAIETSLARAATRSDDSATMDVQTLLLAASAAAEGPIVHVPSIISHRDWHGEEQGDQRLDAVAAHLRPRGATCVPGLFDTVKVQWPLPDPLPLVSIIVPTKDKVELLRACVGTVLERTDYGNFELLIVDNASVEPHTAVYLREVEQHSKVRVVHHDVPYNFSAINNFASSQARGSFLCLLNNDTEVIEPAWLTEMMRYAARADVGAVGAKLLYDDGTIQHAGVVVGIGEAAGHAHRHLRADQPGYFRQAHVAQFVSAVTAACLVIDRKKFDAVGGLDEAELAVAFNDVDLCLKLQAAGWRNVYVPHAVLVHHESKSRGNDISPRNIDRYMRELGVLQQRWGTKTYADPAHNPNLDRYSETFVFRL
jgi:GT2 family glycosyltransferase